MLQSHLTLYKYWKTLAEITPNKRLLGSRTRWLTVQEMLSLSEHLAVRLLALGIDKGDYVALRACRTISSILALIALRTLGAIVVLTDPQYKPTAYLAEMLVPIPIKAIVEQTDDLTFSVATAEKEDSFHLLSLPPVHYEPANIDADAPAFLIFTSGLRGYKKAVILSESNLVNTLVDTEPFGLYRTDDIALGFQPIDSLFGLVILCGTAVLQYALYLPEQTDVPSLLAAIEKEQITRLSGEASLYLSLCDQKGSCDISSLRTGFLSGAIPEKQFIFIENSLGLTLIPVYGMCECVGIACQDGRALQNIRMNGVGRPYEMNNCVILNEKGKIVLPDETGEICVRGPMRMLGYFGHQMDKDEYLHTGDLGYLDMDGILHLTGRN